MFWRRYKYYFIIPITLLITFLVGCAVGIVSDKAVTPVYVEYVEDDPCTYAPDTIAYEEAYGTNGIDYTEVAE